MAPRLPARNWLLGLSAVAFAGLAVAPQAAHAQGLFGLFSFDVSPAEVAANINRHGYVVRSAIVRRGDVYLADVSGPTGAMQRLVIDAHSGQLEQRYAWRGDYYRQGPQPVAPNAGYFVPAPRPEANIAIVHPRGDEFSPSYDDLRAMRERQTAYGGDGRQLMTAPLTPDTRLQDFRPPEVRPIEKPKLRAARPKPAVAPAEASVTPQNDAPPAHNEASTAHVDAPATHGDSSASTTVVTPAPAPEPAKPAAPVRRQGVVASSGESASAPAAPAPVVQVPAPVSAPAKKSINDIPVAPLD